MEDHMIIDLYWARDQRAIVESEDKYGPYCRAIARGILERREDAEECVNDTWLRAWNAMPPQRPSVLRMFFAKITRNLSFDRVRSRTAQKRGGGELPLVLEELSQCIVRESPLEDAVLAQELDRSVRAFLRTLPDRECDVFLRRYFFTEPLADIAAGYGLSRNHVSVLLRRTRTKLRDHLQKEGFLDG